MPPSDSRAEYATYVLSACPSQHATHQTSNRQTLSGGDRQAMRKRLSSTLGRNVQPPAPLTVEERESVDSAEAQAVAARSDRNYIYHNFTNSLCPTCLKVIQAKVILQNNKVYLLKTCPEHGQM